MRFPDLNPSVVALWIEQGEKSQEDGELVERSLQRLEQVYPEVPIFSNRPLRGATVHEAGVLPASAEILAGRSDQDSIAYFHDLYPLLDGGLAKRLAAVHFPYLAHYSFSENIPIGFVPDLLSKEFCDIVRSREIPDLRAFILKNINEFEVEIYYEPPDLRQYRLNLSLASGRSRRLARDALALADDLSFSGLEPLLKRHPEILRPAFSYYEIELCNRRSEKSPLWPLDPRPEMSLDPLIFEKLMDQLEVVSVDPVSIAFGGLGDPLLHSDLISLLSRALTSPMVDRVYLETWGQELPRLDRELLSLSEQKKLILILRLPAVDRTLYRSLTGASLDPLLDWLDGDRRRGFQLYVEIPKIKATEDHIDAYFAFFKERDVPCILYKHNRYIDLLSDERLADLTPRHRDFCWHLARDLYVLASGEVAFCKQDPWGTRAPLLNLQTESLQEILAKTMSRHVHSVRGEHDLLPMPCLSCDEWYTFNA